MLANQAKASSKVQALAPASRSAGAGNGSWLDVSLYEGDLCYAIDTGAVTGSVAYKLEDATSIGGAGAADITGATLAGVADTSGAIVVEANAVRGFVRLVATVTTGPVLCGATLVATPKYL